MIIPDYPEASEALDDDYLVIETRNGTCKIKKINLCHYPGARIISGRGIKVETNEDDETVISLDGYKLQQFQGDIESLSLLVANDEDSNSYKSPIRSIVPSVLTTADVTDIINSFSL